MVCENINTEGAEGMNEELRAEMEKVNGWVSLRGNCAFFDGGQWMHDKLKE